MSHGRNLADYVDVNGNATAGTRFEYPSHLGRDFHNLEWYGSELRRRHGKGTRRNYKFDDEEEFIYLDVCLPGQEYWHKVLPYAARNFKDEQGKERTKTSRQQLEGQLRPMDVPLTDSNRTPLGNGRIFNPPTATTDQRSPTVATSSGTTGYVSPRKRT